MSYKCYVKLTEEGGKVSTKMLQSIISYEELTNCVNKTNSDEPFKVKKGVGYDSGLQSLEKRLAEKISEINLPFEDELRTIEED
jgi:hypothetical protein